MNVKVNFSKSDQHLNTSFTESDSYVNTNFGEVYTIAGGAGSGQDGASAYEIALENGFIGTEKEWLDSLKGEKGDKGDKGDTGARGLQGESGEKGKDGYTPVKGTDYFTAADKAEMVNAVIAALPIYKGEVASV